MALHRLLLLRAVCLVYFAIRSAAFTQYRFLSSSAAATPHRCSEHTTHPAQHYTHRERVHLRRPGIGIDGISMHSKGHSAAHIHPRAVESMSIESGAGLDLAQNSDGEINATGCDEEIAGLGPTQWLEALALLENMEQVTMKPAKATYNTVISLLAQNGQWEKALEIFERVFTRAGQSDPCSTDLIADAHSYRAAILACVKGRQWDRAFTLFDDLHESPEPTLQNAVTHSELVAMCEREAAKGFQLLEPTPQQPEMLSEPCAHLGEMAPLGSQAQWVQSQHLSLALPPHPKP